MRVAKQFRWEGAHRLPWHTEGCQHLHGHSYQLWVELSGEVLTQGMFIDFKEIKSVLGPLIKAWDHGILVADNDTQLLSAIDLLASKHYVLPYDTTSENICQFVVDYLLTHAADVLAARQITGIKVKLQETETCFAELEVLVSVPFTSSTPRLLERVKTL
ncbi:6-carboxytetrahydropterin synthase [Hymenobacter sp. BT559]|uniref:6-pyruvoyl trahydropterin synthase family protein n=1 Tax=Hymenobacter sp. BT559 TaxID=2795729 RepID=UPI0018ED3492|nr:6-carboxytetrahydropterin synthase [Hymenobacter sp. BT559]MBJ6146304.1 6-carboxytetrahydropterin synthase [Hymenobacter sp. BT559]